MKGVTIGQAAAYVGVTVKTVRHYHRIGLLPEPQRDASGYRRYGSPDLVRLVTVRTLASCGVALADIGPLLDGDEADYAAAVDAAQRRLDARIDELVARREQLGALRSGNALLPAPATAVLDRMTALGLPAGLVAAQRDSMTLAHAMAPDFLASYVEQLDRRLDDPMHNRILERAWAAAGWAPDDPRLDEIAREIAQNLLDHPEHLAPLEGVASTRDDRYRLVDRHGADEWPAFARLSALVEHHLRAAGLPVG